MTCPPGFHCENGTCVDTPGGADAAVDGDGGIIPTSCGGSHALAESFDDPDLPWGRIDTWQGATAVVTGGELVMTLPSDPAANAGAHLYSRMRTDLRGQRVYVEVSEMVNTATYASAEFVVTNGWVDYLEFFQIRGVLYLKAWRGNTATSETELTYDPVEHRWWQLREEGGTVYWETSADGQVWTARHSAPTPSFVDRAEVWMSAYTSPGISDPGRVVWDDLNGGGPAPEPFCPAASFADDFDDGDPNFEWISWGQRCSATMQSGQIRVAPNANEVGYCGYAGALAFDLRQSSAHLEVAQALPVGADGLTYFVVHDFNGSKADIVIDGATLRFGLCLPTCIAQAQVAYSATEHRWWRFRGEGGMLHWETSPDAVDWTTRASAAPGFGLEMVAFSMGAETEIPVAAPGEAHFDNYNVVP